MAVFCFLPSKSRGFEYVSGNMAVYVENGGKDPLGVSVSATRAAGKLVVSLVNPKDKEEVTAECELQGVTARNATARILHHADRNAANSFDAPDAITPQSHPARVEDGKLLVDLPPLSVATVVGEIG